jgi:hypothetical protein
MRQSLEYPLFNNEAIFVKFCCLWATARSFLLQLTLRFECC